MIHITAPIEEISTEYRGGSNFTVTTVRVDLGRDRPLDLRATGQEGDRIAATLGQAPKGSYVTLLARPAFREYNDSVYFDLEITDSLMQGNFGSVDTKFMLQGFLSPLERKEGGRGAFYVGNITVVAYGREGVINNANVDMLVNEDAIPAWEASVGKYAIVTGTVSGFKAKNDRVYPRFAAQGVSGTIEVPSWLTEYAPAAATGVAVAPEPVPF